MERAEYIKKEFIDAQTTEVSTTANGAAQKPKGAGGKDDVSSHFTNNLDLWALIDLQ